MLFQNFSEWLGSLNLSNTIEINEISESNSGFISQIM